MHVQSVKLRRFLRHRGETEVRFPDRGIVTLVGPNFSGKSTLVEAISFARWGKTLRGEDPFDDDGIVVVTASDAEASRERRGKKTTLSFTPSAHHAGYAPGTEAQYATTTKAQEALEAIVGDWTTWQQTHVFSTADAARWTLATDGERKRFVEGLLRYDFDSPLDRCRRENRANREVLDILSRALVVERTKKEAAEKRLADALAALSDRPAPIEEDPEPVPPPDRSAEIASLDDQIRKGGAILREIRKRGVEASNRARDAVSERSRAEKERDLLHGGKCPVCKQDIPASMIASLEEGVARATVRAEQAKVETKNEQRGAEEEVAEVEAEQDELRRRQRELDREVDAAKSAFDRLTEKRREQRKAIAQQELVEARAQKTADEAKAAVEASVRAIEENEKAIGERNREIAVLSACEEVLGLRGVRAQVVSRTLDGLERATNVYLRRIFPGALVRIRPYTEKKGGGVADSVSVEWLDPTTPEKRWRPYRAASGGARRRLDVAMLFSLAQVASAARNEGLDGDLVCDEVFDALDDDGIERVSDLLAEISRERFVLVISHNESLVRRLPAVLRLRAADGRISVDAARDAA